MHRRKDSSGVEVPRTNPSPRSAGPRFRLQMLGGLTLVRPDGDEKPRLALSGRKLVILGYVALARRPISRDALATFLWGHRDDERARHSLRDALSTLRQVTGPMIPRGRGQIALSPDAALDVDVVELREAARTANHARVVELYRGPFLDGVQVSDASEAEDWIAEQRHAIARLFAASCAAECTRLAAAGQWEACAALAQRWLEAEPADSSALVSRLRAIAGLGTVAALSEAIAEYERHTVVFRRDYDEGPPPAAVALRAELGDRLAHLVEFVAVDESAVSTVPERESPSPARPAVSPPARRPARRSSFRLSRFVMAAVAGLVLVAVSLAAYVRFSVKTADEPQLIIAGIESPSQVADDKWLESGLPRLLASSLIRAHVPGVVDPSSVRAASRSARLGDANGTTDGATSLLVARRLRAATLVSGEVTRGDGRLLLDLAIRDVATGAVRHRISVSDTSLFGLVGQATARVLAAVDHPGSGFPFENVETSSVDGYRAYVLALDRIDAGRNTDAAALLDAAVGADSSFAAALRLRVAMLPFPSSAGKDSARRLLAALSRSGGRESDFDKAVSASISATQSGDPARAEEIARDLVARYPRDARTYRLLISALHNQGSFAEAVNIADEALAVESADRTTSGDGCVTCGLYGTIVIAALETGEGVRALSAARRAVALNPGEPAPWMWLSRAMMANGRAAEAISAADRAMRLAPQELAAAEGYGWLLLETGHLDAADSLIRDWSRPGSELTATALDLRGALWRERGQHDSAVKVIGRAIANTSRAGDSAALRLVYANSLARTGGIAAAAREFELAAVHVPVLRQTPRLNARGFAWPHALLADALVTSGSRDTIRLIALADSIELLGRRSGYGRDSRLHFHVRGLVAEIGGRWAEAERAFERARWGRGGWTRTNIELARTQLAQGRPLDAVASLQDARFGTLDGMGRYAPRTEITAAIAESFLAAQLPDSARVYVTMIRRAWANANGPERRRLASLEKALQADGAVASGDRVPDRRSKGVGRK